VALGRISAFSFPQYPVYVPPASAEWTAVHASHTEIAPDAVYVEPEQQEWAGFHTDYGDFYLASEPEPEPIADLQSMWGAFRAGEVRNLDGAVIASSVSSEGTLNFTMQRVKDGAAPSQLKVSVLGTEIYTWQPFPAGALTVDMNLPDLPPGTHTVEVLAYAGESVVGTTRFTVTVPAAQKPVEPPPAAEPEPEPEAAQAAPPEEAPPPPPRAPETPAAPREPALPEPAPGRSHPFTKSQLIRRFVTPFNVGEGPKTEQAAPPEEIEASSPAPGNYVAGQAMAAGLGVEAHSAGTVPGEPGRVDPVVPVLEATLGTALDGQGGQGSQQRREQEGEEEAD